MATKKERVKGDALAEREWDAYIRRYILSDPVDEIARHYEVTPRQVHKYIEAASQRVRRVTLNPVEVATTQVVILQEVQKAAMRAWRKSQEAVVTRTAGAEKQGVQKGADKLGEAAVALIKQKTGEKHVQRVGDPNWLRLVLECYDRITKQLGLDDRANLMRLLREGLKGTGTVDDEDLTKLSDAELYERLQQLTYGGITKPK